MQASFLETHVSESLQMRFLSPPCANTRHNPFWALDRSNQASNALRYWTLNRPVHREFRHHKLVVQSEGVQGTDLLVSDSASLDVESSVEGKEESIIQLKDLFRKADLNGSGLQVGFCDERIPIHKGVFLV